jgi:hypothetical protein
MLLLLLQLLCLLLLPRAAWLLPARYSPAQE